jgi:hypothetical protein
MPSDHENSFDRLQTVAAVGLASLTATETFVRPDTDGHGWRRVARTDNESGYLRPGRGPFPSLNANRQRTPACDRIAITRSHPCRF